jgi:hypothetical protein
MARDGWQKESETKETETKRPALSLCFNQLPFLFCFHKKTAHTLALSKNAESRKVK